MPEFTMGMWEAQCEENARLKMRIDNLRNACAKQNEDVCQTLGKVLGYPWYKDDQANFPGATEENGVCVGEHVAETIAEEAARRIEKLEGALRRFAERRHHNGDELTHEPPTFERCRETNCREAAALLKEDTYRG